MRPGAASFLKFYVSKFSVCLDVARTAWAVPQEIAKIPLSFGAGEGNRTLVCSLGSCRSAIELRPQTIDLGVSAFRFGGHLVDRAHGEAHPDRDRTLNN
jgi:hypothetical protein